MALLKRTDVLGLLRVAEDDARSRAKYSHNVSSGRHTTGKGPCFKVAEWRTQYRTQWPKAYAGWLWTGAGALSLDIVPPSIEPASLDATGYANDMDVILSNTRGVQGEMLRLVLDDALQPTAWYGVPVIALKPGHMTRARPTVWVDARLRSILGHFAWYAEDEHCPIAGFDDNRELRAILMPVRV